MPDQINAETLATEAVEDLWHDQESVAFATVHVGGHLEHYRIRSEQFWLWLGAWLYEKGELCARPTVERYLDHLEARARFNGACHDTHIRVARVDNRIYLDLGAQVCEVTADGWSVLDTSPVRFLRPKNFLPLPTPDETGSLEILHDILNVGSDADFRLLVAWCLACLRPDIPLPLLVVNGEAGSAKSTLTKIVQRIIDPNTLEIRSAPANQRDLVAGIKNCWVLAFDNLSSVSPQISDALCQLSTGGAFGGRALYTDHEEAAFRALRPVVLNGIPDLATRQDLADRSIVLSLPTIDEQNRLEEAELWAAFEAAHPAILGALLDAASSALARLQDVQLDRRPRMADLARWITAAEGALGWDLGTFITDYESNRRDAQIAAVEAEPVGAAIRTLVDAGPLEGTATELLIRLEHVANEAILRNGYWPKAANQLSNRLRRLAPALRPEGISIRESRSGPNGQRVWTIARETISTISTDDTDDGPTPDVVPSSGQEDWECPF